MFKVILAVATLAMLAPVAASAGEVQNRINTQQQRINQGVANGSITRSEYNHLENQNRHLEAERNRDLRRNGGHYTAAQFHQLNRQENRVSNHIYVDRHNLRHQF